MAVGKFQSAIVRRGFGGYSKPHVPTCLTWLSWLATERDWLLAGFKIRRAVATLKGVLAAYATLTSTRRGFASSAFGKRSVRTPCFSSAEIDC
jgi:hypothetical protein